MHTGSCFTRISILKTAHLTYTVDSLPLNSRSMTLQHRPEGSLSNTQIFLSGTHHSLPVLKKSRQHFSIVRVDLFSSEITNKSTNIFLFLKTMALDRLGKGQLLAVWELEREGGTRPVPPELGVRNDGEPSYTHTLCTPLLHPVTPNVKEVRETSVCCPAVFYMAYCWVKKTKCRLIVIWTLQISVSS